MCVQQNMNYHKEGREDEPISDFFFMTRGEGGRPISDFWPTRGEGGSGPPIFG